MCLLFAKRRERKTSSYVGLEFHFRADASCKTRQIDNYAWIVKRLLAMNYVKGTNRNLAITCLSAANAGFHSGGEELVSFDLVGRGQCVCLRKCFHPKRSRRFCLVKSGTMIKKSFPCFLPILKAYSLNIQTGKILSFPFYPKAVYFECKFWI